jgi:hypothetical protein
MNLLVLVVWGERVLTTHDELLVQLVEVELAGGVAQ